MVTITDIAAKAGVARSTVSYVLNERNTHVRISDETRLRVMQAAQELGYRRNELARAMTTGKSSVLGFWVMDAQREPDVRILSGAMKEAGAHNHFIKMLSLDSSGDPSQIAERCVDWRLSGIIAINPSHESIDRVLAQTTDRFTIPLVMVEGEGPRPDCLHVTSDQEEGIRALVEHLASLGHRRIAFFGGTPFPEQREVAYRRTMRALGLEVETTVAYTNWDVPTAHRALLEVLESDSGARPSAICCVSDSVAMIVISAAARLGLRVPQDLAVTGFDDLGLAAVYNPPLTTVAQPFEEMGRTAVRLLLEPGGYPAETSLGTRLVVRGSTVAEGSGEFREKVLSAEVGVHTLGG